MKKFTVLACLTLVFVFANAIASDFDYNGRNYQVVDSRYPGIITGKSVDFAKSQADTFYIYGGPDRTDGKFQTAQGEPEPLNEPGWWSSVDLTFLTDPLWHIDTYNAQNLDGNFNPNHAWWCGECVPEWDCGDNCGYGNNWNEQLDFSAAVANPALSTFVTVNAVLNYDMEACCDFLELQYFDALGRQTLTTFVGDSLGHVYSERFQLAPGDYTGDNNDEVLIRWNFYSDSGWSDEDCLEQTDGAAQVDNIQILFDQGSGDVEMSFENNEGAENDWTVTFPQFVGDFAKIWPLLANIDPCRTNGTPLVGFIDDGVVQPGTGGYGCTSWCYGPNGYIVNPEGGLAGPEAHLNNEVWSPILDWPGDQYVTAAYEYDVYAHEDLDATSPGMFFVWHVRSVPDGQDILDAPWADRNFVYYSPNGTWGRTNRFSDFNDGGVISDLMVAGRTQVQLALGAYELGWVWGSTSTDGTPAPYFDNVAFLTWEATGPGMGTREIDIAQDNFPDIGTIDYNDLAANSIRFDMARDVSLQSEDINYAGDSIYVDAVPLRTGSVLNDLPRMYYKLFPNPVFDGIRTYPVPNEGFVVGDSAYGNVSGDVVPDRFEFDLPDAGFFFPGDVINYYFEGQDNLGGDIGTTIIPGDTAGFSGPPQWPAYDSRFRVQGLPTLHSATEDDHPKVLFWNDFGDRGGENEWYYALYNLGNQPGVDFDVYYTNGPSSGVGSGLGGRATSSTIQGYDILLYTCGNLGTMTISNGDFANDPSNDAVLLDTWLQQGDKNMFLTGDDLVYDMQINGGGITQNFVSNWIGVSYTDRDLRPLIDNQATPIVQPVPGNSLNLTLDDWIAYGGCLGFNRFDAVSTAGETEKVAEFLDPNGSSGQYPYAAMTYFQDQTFNVQTVYMPYDLMFVYSNGPDPGPDPIAARTRLLDDVLLFFGHQGQSQAVSVPDAEVFTVRNYPNPFNPSTKIEFFMPQRGELRIKIFNVRGELVRTLVNEVRDQGADFVIWDGSDDRGSAVASGVYFYETRAMGETSVNKMALVK